ncbi:MAG: carbon-nitrogen hydrolase [Deltaproteobacteria bacterium]|nr:carbon-nitrogen hydrolase [Deltaproteobacteria bacterium]
MKTRKRLPIAIIAATALTLSIFIVSRLLSAGAFRPPSAQSPSTLKIALVHFEVKYKEPAKNLRHLIELNRKAAQGGAMVILNTELAVSGYSFQSRRDVAPFTETDGGKTLLAMGRLAKEYGVYIGITFPERDGATQIFYNGAFVLDPQGQLICKYRKIAAEKRWARPGSPLQKGVFDTPWGRMGVLICSDSFYSLMPRAMALKGVDFLWVPANWPPRGGLDPKFIWRSRALENGFFLAACNRTGMDRILDCRQAASYVFDPQGNQLFSASSPTSQVFFVEVPLNEHGRFTDTYRRQILATRKIEQYRPIYLEPWVEDLTKFYKLPKTGALDIRCFVPTSDRINISELEERIVASQNETPDLWILPETAASELKIKELADLAQRRQIAITLAVEKASNKTDYVLVTPEGIQKFYDSSAAQENAFPFRILKYGSAAIALVPYEDFRHPELGVVLSKLGSDLVVLSEERMSPEDMLLSRIKSLTGVAVAACADNGAEITSVQDLHGNWDYQHLSEPGVCSYTLDTAKTRKKSFQSRIDFDLLLNSK